MNISLKWICDFVDISDYLAKPQELADALTASGLEVEGVSDSSKQFDHVVVGHIVEKGQHPDADRLTLCQIDVGDGNLKQIVCGAKNHNKGDKVVVALPGAVLPGDFVIKLSKIRGVESSGMLASESELGLKAESDGILILPSDAPVGTPFAKYYGLDDITLEINVTPNRADCLSHYGLAREIAALLGRELKALDFKPKAQGQKQVQSEIKLEVKDPKLCPRYSARFISKVKVGESPQWIKQRLESVGMNSINNVVDITNYVMMELGQPLHAFDASQLGGKTVIVGQALQGERFATLDGTELKLGGEELTIRDGERAVCLAGVVGGKNSGVTESTTEIFLESAHFSMESVRKTSRKFGLQTDSAYRFSRGTDISMVTMALDRASQLLESECGGEASSDFYDAYPEPKNPAEISIEFSYVSDRLGYEVPAKDFVSWMEKLGLKVKKEFSGGAVFEVPLHRVDLDQDVDLVEEYGRLNGYNKIPDILPTFSSEPLAHDDQALLEDQLISQMTSLGYSQAINYGFTSSKTQAKIFGDLKPVTLKNPISEDLDVMRSSLLPGLMNNLFHNIRYGNRIGRLFELGAKYFKQDQGYKEEFVLGLVAWGQTESLWNKKALSPLFFEVKSTLEALFGSIGSFELKPGDVPKYLHPGQAAQIFCQGKIIGVIGTLHPRLTEEEKVREPVVVAEFGLLPFKRSMKKSLRAKTPSKFQGVERDIAFIIPEDMMASSVTQVIKKVAGPLLQSVVVTDEFRGGDVPEGHKSLSFRMILQDAKRTLEDKELLKLQNQLIEQAEKKLSVKLR